MFEYVNLYHRKSVSCTVYNEGTMSTESERSIVNASWLLEFLKRQFPSYIVNAIGVPFICINLEAMKNESLVLQYILAPISNHDLSLQAVLKHSRSLAKVRPTDNTFAPTLKQRKFHCIVIHSSMDHWRQFC